MLYIIRFQDKPGMTAERQRLMEAHLAWLAANRSWVLLAGALRETPEAMPLGGLWLVDVASKEELVEKMKTDPFWVQGLRAGYEVNYWGMALPDMHISAAFFKRAVA